MTTKTIRPGRVRPGDYADHKSGELDPRPVAEVDHAAKTVRLRIFDSLTPPLPRANYTYFRRTEGDQTA